MRTPRVSRKSAAKVSAGFAAGLMVAAAAFCWFAPGPARPTFVTHLQWRLEPPRVDIQAGHAETYNALDELQVLHASIGAYQDDWGESIVNRDIAHRVVAILEREGLRADYLPTTVPPHYKADAFVALHSDAWDDDKLSGFKATRGEWSTSTLRDNALVDYLVAEYAAGVALAEHRASISDNMREYYAFNYKKFEHAIDPSTPGAILEMGFLTNDRRPPTAEEATRPGCRGDSCGHPQVPRDALR